MMLNNGARVLCEHRSVSNAHLLHCTLQTVGVLNSRPNRFSHKKSSLASRYNSGATFELQSLNGLRSHLHRAPGQFELILSFKFILHLLCVVRLCLMTLNWILIRPIRSTVRKESTTSSLSLAELDRMLRSVR